MSAINVALMDTGLGNTVEFLLGLALGIAAVLLAAILVYLAISAFKGIPFAVLSMAGGALIALWYLKDNSPASIARRFLSEQSSSQSFAPDAFSVPSLSILAVAIALIVGLLWLLWKSQFSALTATRKVLLVVACLGFTLVSVGTVRTLVSDGYNPYPNDGARPERLSRLNPSGNPAETGDYTVSLLTYGAGTNPRRPEFGSERDIESRTVDARKLLPEWTTFKKRMREDYWGFGLDSAPLNGRIWMPGGEGPFPLVLIVHGNHGMEDYSDDGYAYLGELLASRGFVTVSVDQNYINGSWSGDFQGKEMAARGWLLLEHLALWRDWNLTPGHPFESKIDMNNLALVGHSRGGEAVSIAHSFNRLSHFPDDATVSFDYGFNVRALVAIAQVDQRYHRRVQLRDVDFFSIHGSYDSDEPAYHGLRQMNRISFSNADYHFKAGVYLHGANHGQFNSGWGRYDYSAPGSWTLNTAPIIPGEEQREAAKVYISAFLESSLHRDESFIDYLKDPRSLATWLPAQTYVHQFADSSFMSIANFEEDIDTATASHSDARIAGLNLAVWREEALRHRDKRLQGSNAVVIGWNGADASYAIRGLDYGFASEERSLVFAVSGSTEKLPDLPTDGDSPQSGGSKSPTIANFSVSLLANGSQAATLAVSEFAQLIPPVRVQYLKNKKQNKEQYNAVWEPVLQYVEIPFEAFRAAHPELLLAEIDGIRFDFDQTDKGILILDDIGSVQRTRAAVTSKTEVPATVPVLEGNLNAQR
ncbi:hypothetical protein [Congregibacter sp.]|uniref:hypothetical protein n=1 Tax=Congregibacter sp. TaxID=2744308 RepID=UPI00385F9CFF